MFRLVLRRVMLCSELGSDIMLVLDSFSLIVTTWTTWSDPLVSGLYQGWWHFLSENCKTGRRWVSSGNLVCFSSCSNTVCWAAPLDCPSQVQVYCFSKYFPVFRSSFDFLLQWYLTQHPCSMEQWIKELRVIFLCSVLSLSFIGTDVVVHIGNCSLFCSQARVWSY